MIKKFESITKQTERSPFNLHIVEQSEWNIALRIHCRMWSNGEFILHELVIICYDFLASYLLTFQLFILQCNHQENLLDADYNYKFKLNIIVLSLRVG